MSQIQKSVTFESGFQKPHFITVFEENLEGVSKLVRVLKLLRINNAAENLVSVDGKTN